jgi:hypothetical protein
VVHGAIGSWLREQRRRTRGPGRHGWDRRPGPAPDPGMSGPTPKCQPPRGIVCSAPLFAAPRAPPHMAGLVDNLVRGSGRAAGMHQAIDAIGSAPGAPSRNARRKPAGAFETSGGCTQRPTQKIEWLRQPVALAGMPSGDGTSSVTPSSSSPSPAPSCPIGPILIGHLAGTPS